MIAFCELLKADAREQYRFEMVLYSSGNFGEKKPELPRILKQR